METARSPAGAGWGDTSQRTRFPAVPQVQAALRAGVARPASGQEGNGVDHYAHDW